VYCFVEKSSDSVGLGVMDLRRKDRFVKCRKFVCCQRRGPRCGYSVVQTCPVKLCFFAHSHAHVMLMLY